MNDYSEKTATMSRNVSKLIHELETKNWEKAAQLAAYLGSDAIQVYQWVMENQIKGKSI